MSYSKKKKKSQHNDNILIRSDPLLFCDEF